METRVLTLFDDEDFFPKEEPKKKPKKETVAIEIEHKEEITSSDQNTEPYETETLAAQESEQSAEPEILSAAEQEVEENHEHDIIDEPKNKVPEVELTEETDVPADETEQYIEEFDSEEIIEVETEENITHEETETEAAETVDEYNIELEDEHINEDAHTESKAADEELNKQILSELIQMDYTALIHRDYPFDINKASVIEKKEPARIINTPEIIEEDEDEIFEDIVPLPEWNLDKKYYTIGEVAQLFAVNTSHIRFWTNEFKLKPRTTRKGDRLYNPKDIAELRLIHHLVKEKKHTIKGAKEKLKAGKNDVNNKLDLKDSLLNLRDTLLQIKAQL